MKYLLDTDHLSILQWKEGEGFERLSGRIAAVSQDDLSFCVISFQEQALGWNAYLSKSKTIQRIVHGYEMFLDLLDFYSTGQILPFNEAAALTAMELKQQRKVRLKPMDLRIAATALTNNLTLLTRNSVDFEHVPGLRIEDWTR